MAKILMIEDNLEFAELLIDFLSKYNIQITNFEDPYLALSAGISNYDLIILDLSLPGMDGLEVCKKIVQYNDIPIIVSSARHNIIDKVTALEIGADDYMAKPYDPNELYARIISLMRRYKKISLLNNQARLTIDINTEYVNFNNETLLLTPAEYDVLSELNRHKNSVISREQIIGSSNILQDSSPKSLDVLINRLRRKMRDKNREYIRTIRGTGYKLNI
jgi:two-component system OmpR family response regulator